MTRDRLQRRRTASGPRRGFALLEMMITIMVFTIGLLALASYQTAMQRQMREGSGMVLAASVARARFEQLNSVRCQTLAAGTYTATTKDINEKWLITAGVRGLTVRDSVSFRLGRSMARKTVGFQMVIPCIGNL